MFILLFILAVVAFWLGSSIPAAILTVGGVLCLAYELNENRKYNAQLEETERREAKELAREEKEEEQREYDSFFRSKGFPHILDKVRVEEFARLNSMTLEEADNCLCAADALGSLEKGRNIAALAAFVESR
ncbi:MAG TPA: hypothetical protein VFA74_09295 [Terriglobales bacterium]|nr:hypothetical protein [Terriglobales bacterium]